MSTGDLKRPTLAEFIEIAAAEYDVRRFDLMFEVGGHRKTVLVRPRSGAPHLHVTISEMPANEPLPTETIVRYCRALGLRPHDFGVFIG